MANQLVELLFAHVMHGLYMTGEAHEESHANPHHGKERTDNHEEVTQYYAPPAMELCLTRMVHALSMPGKAFELSSPIAPAILPQERHASSRHRK